MACLSLGLSAPSLPAIFLPSGIGVSISVGTVGITCCHYTFPARRVDIPIPIPANILAVAAAAVNAAIDEALELLDQVQIPDCPTE
jgi:hypothetical protein